MTSRDDDALAAEVAEVLDRVARDVPPAVLARTIERVAAFDGDDLPSEFQATDRRTRRWRAPVLAGAAAAVVVVGVGVGTTYLVIGPGDRSPSRVREAGAACLARHVDSTVQLMGTPQRGGTSTNPDELSASATINRGQLIRVVAARPDLLMTAPRVAGKSTILMFVCSYEGNSTSSTVFLATSVGTASVESTGDANLRAEITQATPSGQTSVLPPSAIAVMQVVVK